MNTTKKPYPHTAVSIAKEIGITPQAIYKRLSTEFINQLNNEVEQLPNGKKRFSEEGANQVKQLFTKVVQPVQQPVEQPTNSVVQPVQQQLFDELKAEIADLKKQLAIEREFSRTQSERILAVTERVTNIAENQQKLTGIEHAKSARLLTGGEKKTGFFDRFRRKKEV